MCLRKSVNHISYNYKIQIAYDGTRYQGWQLLGGESRATTIQGILTDFISEYCNEPVNLIGAGRTDAAVHATGQVANFYTTKDLEEGLLTQWNQNLPSDIQIVSLEKVPDKFHSRYDAIGKQYQYQIYCKGKPTPFLRNHCLAVDENLDLKAMREAASLLVGKHDFAGFASPMSDGRTTIKTITGIRLIENDNLLTIVYEGDGFLYHMLRIITGTLIEVGQHIRSVDSIKEVLRTLDRRLAGPTVDGKGLILTKVYYKNM